MSVITSTSCFRNGVCASEFKIQKLQTLVINDKNEKDKHMKKLIVGKQPLIKIKWIFSMLLNP